MRGFDLLAETQPVELSAFDNRIAKLIAKAYAAANEDKGVIADLAHNYITDSPYSLAYKEVFLHTAGVMGDCDICMGV